MKQFIKTYNDLMNNSKKIQYVGLNIFNVLNQWVQSPDLIEFPKQLQISLCKNLRKRYDNLYIISYEKIIEILKQYNYDYTDDVIQSMNKYKAINRGYLIIITLNIDDSENFLNNKTLNFIKSNFNDIYDNAYDIFSKIYNNRYADGLTIFHRDQYQPENTYTCIYINRNVSNMKDTLQHQLTHFIRNVAKYSNKFPKTYSGLTANKLKNRKIQCVDYISNILTQLNFSKIAISSIKEIAIRAFTEAEEQPTIKSIVNSFIRHYENDLTKYEINHIYRNVSYIENNLNLTDKIKFREKWLNEFLKDINNFNFLKTNKKLIENYFLIKQYEKNYKIQFILKCISYLCFKFNYPEYDIDNILIINFKKFKFRDV